jgi:heterodisulfide reductase subunit A-like polyferredoxin
LTSSVALTGGNSSLLSGPEIRHLPWSQTHWEREADIVVVGSGAAGVTAALTAARHGRDVLLLTK